MGKHQRSNHIAQWVCVGMVKSPPKGGSLDEKIGIPQPVQSQKEWTPSAANITEMLWDWCEGDAEAFNQVIAQTYDELHKVARSLLRDNNLQNSLPATAMIHELYLRFSQIPTARFENRKQFFGFAGTALRHILVDYVRSKKASKRGSGQPEISLESAENFGAVRVNLGTIISVHEALNAFESVDPRQAKVVELRYFGGFSIKEIALALEIAEATVYRELASAKLWLARYIRSSSES